MHIKIGHIWYTLNKYLNTVSGVCSYVFEHKCKEKSVFHTVRSETLFNNVQSIESNFFMVHWTNRLLLHCMAMKVECVLYLVGWMINAVCTGLALHKGLLPLYCVVYASWITFSICVDQWVTPEHLLQLRTGVNLILMKLKILMTRWTQMLLS